MKNGPCGPDKRRRFNISGDLSSPLILHPSSHRTTPTSRGAADVAKVRQMVTDVLKRYCAPALFERHQKFRDFDQSDPESPTGILKKAGNFGRFAEFTSIYFEFSWNFKFREFAIRWLLIRSRGPCA
jgi:hypothetical protein